MPASMRAAAVSPAASGAASPSPGRSSSRRRSWLLDEPTAHLDAASEDALVATLREATRGRTVLVATHSERLAAIADVVVRLGEARQ